MSDKTHYRESGAGELYAPTPRHRAAAESVLGCLLAHPAEAPRIRARLGGWGHLPRDLAAIAAKVRPEDAEPPAVELGDLTYSRHLAAIVARAPQATRTAAQHGDPARGPVEYVQALILRAQAREGAEGWLAGQVEAVLEEAERARIAGEIATAYARIRSGDAPEAVYRGLADRIRAHRIAHVDGGEELAVVTADTIEAEAVRWLWYPRIPAGSLTMLSGDGGAGKTFVACELAARVSTGRAWPGERERREPGFVLFLSAEDGAGDTLRPRLDAVGADLSRVGIIVNRGREQGTREGYVTLPSMDLSSRGGEWLDEQVERYRPALLIVDPLTAFMPSVNVHSDNEVRCALGPLARLANVYGTAVLAIRHMPKQRAERAAYAGLGSVAFSNLARSELFAISEENDDPQDRTTRSALYHVKMNLAEKGESLSYEIRSNSIGVSFTWTGVTRKDYRDALAPEGGERYGGSLETADEFLREILAEGPRSAADIYRLAEEAGISRRTVERASRLLRPQLQKRSARRDHKIAGWEWALTGQNAPQPAQETEDDERF